MEGRIFLVPPGTPVEILGQGTVIDYYQNIRVLEGTYQGKEGWILEDWVK